MNYETFSSQLPAERTLHFDSAEENEEFMFRNEINQEMRPLRRGPFQSDFAWRSSPSADIYADRFSTACRIYLEPPPGMVGLLWARSTGDPFLASGSNAANTKLLFMPRNTVVGFVLPDLAGSEVIGLKEERFQEMLDTYCPSCEQLDSPTLFEGNTAGLQAHTRTILRLLGEPGEELAPECVSNLLAAVFGWIDDSAGQSPTVDIDLGPACRPIAKKTEEFIQEHYQETIQIEDICRETGVGLRTLQRCVRTYFDITITELIESVRMTAAHRELTERRPDERTVTQIALDNGFSHLGRFSQVYRKRYGLTPSEQLAHCAGQKT